MARRRRATRGSGSVAKNALWFCISLTILVGASLLFRSIIQWKDLPLKEILAKEASKVAILAGTSQEKPSGPEPAKVPETRKPAGRKGALTEKTQTAAVNTYKYTFYDILTPPTAESGRSARPVPPSHFAVQLGAFKSRKQAQEYREELKKTRRLDTRLARKGEWTVVLWGSFPTRSAAERSNRQVSRMLSRECMVVGAG